MWGELFEHWSLISVLISSLGWEKKSGCLKWFWPERDSVEKNGQNWKWNIQHLRTRICFGIASHQHILSQCFMIVLVLLLMMKGKCYCTSSRSMHVGFLWQRYKQKLYVCFVCRIKYASKAGKENIPLDWALGAFILNTDTPTSDYNGKSRKMIGFK